MKAHQNSSPPFQKSPNKPTGSPSQKNINKLIFDLQDEDDEDGDDRNFHINLHRSVNVNFHANCHGHDNGYNGTEDVYSGSEDSNTNSSVNLHSSFSQLQRLKSVRLEGGSKMVPSMMGGRVEQDNYMLEGPDQVSKKDKSKGRYKARDKDKDKYRVIQTQKLKNPRVFNFDDEQIEEKSQNKCEQSLNVGMEDLEENQSQLMSSINIDLTKIQNIPIRIKPKSAFFQNEPPPKTTQQSSKNAVRPILSPRPQPQSQQIQQQQSLVFDLDQDQLSNQPNLTTHANNSLPTSPEQPLHEPQLQLINPSPQTTHLSQQLSTKLGQLQDPHNKRIFVMTPVPQGVYFDLEVHKYKSFGKTEYLLWLEYGHGDGQGMSVVGKAVSDRLYLEKVVFTVEVVGRGEYKNQKEKCYIGEFVSNFKRDVFTLYDHQNYQKPQQNDSVLCTVATTINYLYPKLKSQQLYTPKPPQPQPQSTQSTQSIQLQFPKIPNNSLSKNLKKLHKISKFLNNNVQKYCTHIVPVSVIEKMREKFKVVTNTTRNAVLRDQRHQVKMVFLKVQQDRFKVRVGAGLTPLQAFCYAIVHLQ